MKMMYFLTFRTAHNSIEAMIRMNSEKFLACEKALELQTRAFSACCGSSQCILCELGGLTLDSIVELPQQCESSPEVNVELFREFFENIEDDDNRVSSVQQMSMHNK